MRAAAGRGSRLAAGAAALVLGVWYLLGAQRRVDADIWHCLTLAGSIMLTGRIPITDEFAYKPTVVPVVHHARLSGT